MATAYIHPDEVFSLPSASFLALHTRSSDAVHLSAAELPSAGVAKPSESELQQIHETQLIDQAIRQPEPVS